MAHGQHESPTSTFQIFKLLYIFLAQLLTSLEDFTHESGKNQQMVPIIV